MAKGTNRTFKDLKVGDKFSIEFFTGEIGEELSIKDFLSGSCYLNLQANVNKREFKQKQLNGKNKKEEEEVDPYAPTNGVDLTAIKL